jgi:uracil-DNA glycosylase family 4
MRKIEALRIIAEKVASCTRCEEISQYRIANKCLTAAGEGNPDARIFVLGEALGKNESEQGRPFVGKAGALLTKILQAAGWRREDVFITNILRCRPPNNRDPLPEEAKNCRQFLDMQLRCVQPEWILCLGRIASVYLLGLDPDTTIGSLRGKIHEFAGKKVICSYHPSYLLRNPAAKELVWQDLQPVIFALQGNAASV